MFLLTFHVTVHDSRYERIHLERILTVYDRLLFVSMGDVGTILTRCKLLMGRSSIIGQVMQQLSLLVTQHAYCVACARPSLAATWQCLLR